MKQYSISQVLHLTEVLQRILITKLENPSEKSLVAYKKFINRCNSVFIIFAHFNITGPAFEVIFKAFVIDLKYYFYKHDSQQSWEGRILMYCNMSYMMFLISDYTSSLKFLYDAESLIKECVENRTIFVNDLILSHSSLSALVLFYARRYETIEKYIERVVDQFNCIIRGDRKSKLNVTCCRNLYCLVTLMLEVLKSQNDGLLCTTNSIGVAKKMKKFNVSANDLLHSYNMNSSIEHGISLIKSPEFHTTLFAACIFPYVKKSTPTVHISELKKAQEYAASHKFTKKNIANYIGKPNKSFEQKDTYALIMAESLQNSHNFNIH